MNAQENYEQLKRRNRRRLVGALIMVVIAAILLVIMLSRRTPQSVPAPQLEVRTASSETASGTAGMVSQASVVAQAQSASAIVLEPVTAARSSSVNTTVGSGNASAVSEHKQENSISRPVMREETTHPKPVLPAKINNTPVPSERRPNDTDSAGIKPSSE